MHIPAVTIDHKTFRLEVPALDLLPGEILGIFGKSGAGKTSYLKRVRERMDPHEVHYMSQFDGLLEDITVRQNIELGLAAGGKSLKDAGDWERAFASILSDFEVNRHIHKYPRAMSGGQRKRTEIVRSLIMNPPLLLLDEPFTGIGHLFEAVCTTEILKRGKDATTNTIIVSHDLDLLAAFCHRIMLVDDRGIIGFVPTRDALWHPENVRTAWTMGVENVIPERMLARFGTEGLPPIAADQSLGFWARSAEWKKGGEKTIIIPRNLMTVAYTTVKQGMTYTRIGIDQPGVQNDCACMAQGNIPESGDLFISLREPWALNA